MHRKINHKKIILVLSMAGLLVPGRALAENFPHIVENIVSIASPSDIDLASPSEIASYSNIEIVPEEEEETTVMLPGATRLGFIFDHWNTEKDDSGDTYYEGDVVDLNDVTDLYAFWEEDPDYVASPSEIPDEEMASPSELEEINFDEEFSVDETENTENTETEETEAKTEETVENEEETVEESEAETETEIEAETEIESTLETEEETEAEVEKKNEEVNTVSEEKTDEKRETKNIVEKVSEKVSEAVSAVKEKVAEIFHTGKEVAADEDA